MKKGFLRNKWILITLVLIVALRVALPAIGKYAVNWYLGNEITPYHGHIDDFDLSLHRGAYQFQGFVIEKNPEPEKEKQTNKQLSKKTRSFNLFKRNRCIPGLESYISWSSSRRFDY